MKRMIAWLVALLVPLVTVAQQPKAFARTSIQQKGDVWMGQRVVLVVELLAPGYFSGTPSFSLPSIGDVLIIPPIGSPAVSTEEVGGVSYTMQRHELMLFSQVEGAVTLPPCEVRVEYKRGPLDKDPVKEPVMTQQVSFKVVRPPGTRPGQTVITSSDLKVEESWKPEPGTNAKVGDAFVRTLKWTASDVTGMAFPPFRPAPIQGLGTYAADPIVEDFEERGALQGQRTDTVTYVCKTGGHFEIPPLSVTWWDPETKELKKTSFKAHAFDVPMPPVPPVPATAKLAKVWREQGPLLIAGAVGVLFLALALRVFGARLMGFLRRLLPRHLPSLNP